MKDKELLKQLHSLKDIKPDYEWKKNNRDFLLSKIYDSQLNGSSVEATGFLSIIKQKFSFPVLRIIPQPVFAVVLILVFVMGSGIISIRAARDSKPGDSLYIAKIINEKTQFVLATNEKKKAQLGIEFAGNRARELSRVIAEDTNGEKQEKVEELLDRYKKEISGVKNRLEKINVDTKVAQTNEVEKNDLENTDSNEEDSMQVFSAQLGKDENGIQISEPKNTIVNTDPILTEPEVGTMGTEVTSTPVILEVVEVSSTTEESDIIVPTVTNPEEILIEAGELLENEDYEGALTKLSEADEAIIGIDEGEVKGVSEVASSTENSLDENTEDIIDDLAN